MIIISVGDGRARADVYLSQVESFVEVARLGHLTRAAEALSISQPALTARLQALEAELGQQLFRRAHAGMRLTPAGRAFLPYASRAVESIEDGVALLTNVARGAAGELVFGAAPAVSAYVLPALLRIYAQQHPQVRLVVRTGHSEEIADLVASGEVDFGIVRGLGDPRFGNRPLYEDEVVLVATPDHPFAATGRIELARIAETRLVLFDRTSSYYELTRSLFRTAGLTPGSVLELDNVDAAKKMVNEGLGVALLPLTAVATDIAGGLLRRIEVVGAKPIRRQIVLVTRNPSAELSPVAIPFVELLKRVAELIPGARPIREAV
jgi:DNA-binding transcriptional LysR family regulator